MKIDTVIINGKILTMENYQPFAEAIAISDGKIEAIGSNKEILRLVKTETQIIDAKQNTVLPGFIDAHVHFMGTGLDASSVYITGISNHKELIDRLKAYEAGLKDNVWLRGYGYDETKFLEKTLPDIETLNTAFPNRPVFLSRIDAHSCFLNDIAFKLLEIEPETEGVIHENGRFTGVLRAMANSKARKKMSEELITDEVRKDAMFVGAQIALKEGVTSLHALEGGSLFSDKDVDVMLKYQQELPIRTLLYHQITDVAKVKSEGLDRIGGCITVDGSLGSYTAALLEPYTDKPTTAGVPYMTQKDIDDFVMEAHTSNMQIAMHTIGDKAIEMLMLAYEKALGKYPRNDHRHRFEHFSVPTYDQIRRAGELKVCISVQPSFDYLTSRTMMPVRLGPERVKRSYPLRSLIEEGLTIAGGSDSNITPISPLLGIYSSMLHTNKLQRLSLYESIKLFTINAAYLGFEEKVKGSLKVGKLADIVILQGDLLNTPAEEVKDMKILQTIVGGQVKYQNY